MDNLLNSAGEVMDLFQPIYGISQWWLALVLILISICVVLYRVSFLFTRFLDWINLNKLDNKAKTKSSDNPEETNLQISELTTNPNNKDDNNSNTKLSQVIEGFIAKCCCPFFLLSVPIIFIVAVYFMPNESIQSSGYILDLTIIFLFIETSIIAFCSLRQLSYSSGQEIKDILCCYTGNYINRYSRGVYYVLGYWGWLVILLLLLVLWSFVAIDVLSGNEDSSFPIFDEIIFNVLITKISVVILSFALLTIAEFVFKSNNRTLTYLHFFNSILILIGLVIVTSVITLFDAIALESVAEKMKLENERLLPLGIEGALQYANFFIPTVILGLAPRLAYILSDKFFQFQYMPDDTYCANVLSIRSRLLSDIFRGYGINSDIDILNVENYKFFKWFLYPYISKDDTEIIEDWLHAVLIKHITGDLFGYFYSYKEIRRVGCLLEYIKSYEIDKCENKDGEDNNGDNGEDNNGDNKRDNGGDSNESDNKGDRIKRKDDECLNEHDVLIKHIRINLPHYKAYKRKIEEFSKGLQDKNSCGCNPQDQTDNSSKPDGDPNPDNSSKPANEK